MSLTTLSLRDLLEAFSSKEPVPGGGSAAALAGALGASLLLMVTRLPRTRTGAATEAAALAAAAARLHDVRERLMALIDDDSRAYAAVPAALRLPRTTPEEQAERRAAIQRALQAATEVPLETMRQCQQALSVGVSVAENGNPNAETDTGTAAELLLAALHGAAMNVDVNLRSITDQAFVSRARLDRQLTQEDGESDAATVMELIGRE
jgi:formiminotetrahydrofolate cyclodeaminase